MCNLINTHTHTHYNYNVLCFFKKNQSVLFLKKNLNVFLVSLFGDNNVT